MLFSQAVIVVTPPYSFGQGLRPGVRVSAEVELEDPLVSDAVLSLIKAMGEQANKGRLKLHILRAARVVACSTE